LFYSNPEKGRYEMKFLLIVLTIHFVAEMIGNKMNENNEESGEVGAKSRHPAEFDLR
jgi:hypothetical protein